MKHMSLLCDLSELSWIFSDSTDLDSFLDSVVAMVANHMHAQVCSIYLYDDSDQMLTMRATKGLDAVAVGSVRMHLGEGLVGLALKELRPICEKAASQHPCYKAFEGIHEEKYDSFLAVPIMRGISRVGVLVVQREKRAYFREEDTLALKVVASQLANIIENARLFMDLSQPVKAKAPEKAARWQPPPLVKGKSAAEGVARGPAIVYRKRRKVSDLLTKRFSGTYGLGDFNAALAATEQQLEALQQQVEEKLSDVASLIFSAHLLMLRDKAFVGSIAQLIEKGENAPRAVLLVADRYMNVLGESENAYIREKVQDVEDLTLRVLGNLVREEKDFIFNCRGHVIIARDLFPSDILKFSGEEAAGVVLVGGGVTSHLSILSRSLHLPMVIANDTDLLKVPAETRVLLDADVGNIYLNPSADVVARFDEQELLRTQTQAQKDAVRPETFTQDGQRLQLLANINLLSDLAMARDLQAEGVGLYRSEFPFMIRNSFPTEEEQYVVYCKLVEGMPGKSVTFRTLDVGGDKVLPYLGDVQEQNPFLGLRSIRFSLRNREVFRQQLRAILRASADTSLRLMFPMVSSIEEFIKARVEVLACIDELKEQNVACNQSPQIGMMVEIPSVVEIIDELAELADFFSLGTNDFIQYMLAVDRTNETVAPLYIPHHPAVLRSLNRVVQAALRKGKEVSVCGDMAHAPKYIPFLIGIGVRSLSVDPLFLYKVQQAVMATDSVQAADFAQKLLGKCTVAGISGLLDAQPISP